MNTRRGPERGNSENHRDGPDPWAEKRLIEFCERMLRAIQTVVSNTSPKSKMSWQQPSLSWQPAESIAPSSPGHAAVLTRPDQSDQLAVFLLDLQASHGVAAVLFSGPTANGDVAPLESALLSRLWLQALQQPGIEWRLNTTMTRFQSLPFRSSDVVACLDFPIAVGDAHGVLSVYMSPELAARQVGDATGTDVLPVVSSTVTPVFRIQLALENKELAELSEGDILLLTNGEEWLWPAAVSVDNREFPVSASIAGNGLRFLPEQPSETGPTRDGALLAELSIPGLDEGALDAGYTVPWKELEVFTLTCPGSPAPGAAELVKVDGNLGLRVLEWP